MTIFRKENKMIFWPHPRGPCVCNDSIFAFMVLCAQLPLIWYATWLLSEKRYSLTFWPHPLGRGCVCGQNICYHVAASIVSFNLICNMTIFWKSLNLASAPPPKSTQWTQTQAFKLKSHLICFISIAALPVCKISAKNINNCLSYCEILIFDLWPLRWGQREMGWHAYLQALRNHGL